MQNATQFYHKQTQDSEQSKVMIAMFKLKHYDQQYKDIMNQKCI